MLMCGSDQISKGKHEIEEEDEDEKRMREREEVTCDLFYLFDRDRSGTISLDELSNVMVKFGGLTKPEIDILLDEADLDGDGLVINI